MSDQQPPGNPYGDGPPPFSGGYAGGAPAAPTAPQVANPLAAATAAASAAPQQWGAYAPPSSVPGRRPGTITAAGIITIIFSALTALGGGIGIVALTASRQEMLDRLRDNAQLADFDGDQIVTAGVVTMAVLLVWSLAAIGLAVLAMRRSNVARILLVVSSVVTSLFSLIAILSIISLLSLVAGIVVVVLLFTGGANPWYAAKPGASHVPPGPPPLS